MAWIVNMTVSLGGYPCLDSSQNPKLLEAYPLLKSNSSGCGDYGDTEGYMDYLEEKSQISFYDDNGIYYSTISKLPYFDDYSANSKDYFELYSEKRVRLAHNDVCWNMKSNVLEYPIDVFSTVTDTIQIFNIILLSLCTLMIILIILGCCLHWFHKKKFNCLIFILFVVTVLLIFILGVFIFVNSEKLETDIEILETYEEIIDEKCFENDSYNTALSYKINILYYSSYLIFVLGVVLWTLMIVFCIMLFICILIRVNKNNEGPMTQIIQDD